MKNELELWENGPRVPLPDKPSDYTDALAWVGAILAGIGVVGAFVWWLCYYVMFRAQSCHSEEYSDNTWRWTCHRVVNDQAGYVLDGIIGAILFTVMMALLTAGLRNLRK